MEKAEIKKQLKHIAQSIADLMLHYEDYSKDVDVALSEARDHIDTAIDYNKEE